MGTPKPSTKACKSMQKHAKAPLNSVFRDYSLKESFGQLYRDFKTVTKACKSMQKHAKAWKSTIKHCFS